MLHEKQIELIEKLKQGLDALKEILESEKKVDNKPFPKEYQIPIHTLVKRVDRANAFTYRVAICTWHGPLVKITCETEGGEYIYHCTPDCLYPVNPADHPEHPEFGKRSQYVWEDMLDKLQDNSGPTMVRSNDGQTETVESANPPLTINTERKDGKQIGEIDLSKHKAFPAGYIVPKDKRIRAIKVVQDDHVKYGAIGTIVGDGTDVPKFICDNDSNIPTDSNGKFSVFEYIYQLAPLDPTDHPDYKQEEVGVNDAEMITYWLEGYTCQTLKPRDRQALIDQINALVQYEVNKAKR